MLFSVRGGETAMVLMLLMTGYWKWSASCAPSVNAHLSARLAQREWRWSRGFLPPWRSRLPHSGGKFKSEGKKMNHLGKLPLMKMPCFYLPTPTVHICNEFIYCSDSRNVDQWEEESQLQHMFNMSPRHNNVGTQSKFHLMAMAGWMVIV